jgi:filamentous hemagglutinin family protein
VDLFPHIRHSPILCLVFILIIGLLLNGLLPLASRAEVSTHITSDGTLGTKVPSNCSVCDISGGTQYGTNLFHSFEHFSIGPDGAARFSSPGEINNIHNILSRVTGPEPSQIYGRLQSMNPKANLFLLNPNGVIFGPNATIDIGGSFHVSTANFMRLGDKGFFYTDSSKQNTLNATPPSAFSFTGEPPPALAAKSPAAVTIDGLDAKGSTVIIVGRDGTPQNGSEVVAGVKVRGTLQSAGGQVNLVSVATPGEVPLTVSGAVALLGTNGAPLISKLGRIEISEGSAVDVSGDEEVGGGTVSIRGSRLWVDHADISADTGDKAGAAVGIDIIVTEAVDIRRNGTITSTTRGTGHAGHIKVSAHDGKVTVSGGSEIASNSINTAGVTGGRAGNITVQGGQITLMDSAKITSSSRGSSRATGGQAGNIMVQGGQITLMERAQINGDTRRGGDTGNITVQGDQIALMSGGQINNRASGGDGQLGIVTLDADDKILISGRSGTDASRVSSAISGGKMAGNVTMSAPAITIKNGAEIQTSTSGQGAAGDIVIKGGDLILRDKARIFSTTAEGGRGGTVTITEMDTVTISDATIDTSTAGSGHGGSITLETGTIELNNGAIILSESQRTREGIIAGDAGRIHLNATDISLREGSSVTTKAKQADGGEIELISRSLVRLQDSTITAMVEAETNGGNITIESPLLLLENSKIKANAPEGRGGNIHIKGEGFVQDANSSVDASGKVDGTVEIDALRNPYVTPPPPTPDMLESVLQYQSCAQRFWQSQPSTFVLAGRGHIPIEPGNILSNTLYWAEQRDTKRDLDQILHRYKNALQKDQYKIAQKWLDKARQHAYDFPRSPDKAYFLIDIAWAYHKLRPHVPAANAELALHAVEILNEASDIAEASGSPRAASYAWGYLGILYELEQRYQDALQLTHRAVFEAQKVQAPESLYRWQWQTGRLLRALGNPKSAMAAYKRAIDTVQPLRPALFRQDRETQGSFRSEVGALYYEFIDLLLRQAASHEETDQKQYEKHLEQARITLEQFRDIELRNYFDDPCVNASPPSVDPIQELHTVSQKTAVVYPILLPDRTELLVSLPNGKNPAALRRFMAPFGAEFVIREARALRQALDNDTLRRNVERKIFPDLSPAYLPHAKTLYDCLVRPLETALQQANIDTLIVVPDGPLHSIPLAVLHDSRQFLIKKYALAITPSLLLINPLQTTRNRFVALASGISQSTQDELNLPLVKEELQTVQNLHHGKMLLNRDFCFLRLQRELQYGRFNLLHIASHGKFDKTSGLSFIRTFDNVMWVDQIKQLVDPLRFRGRPLELLVLSACDTAKGRPRSGLGLSSMAIVSGAKSVLATLWSIQDDSTLLFMRTFYEHLRNPHLSSNKAEALRRTQLEMMQNTSYDHPFFWSPFLLINNWFAVYKDQSTQYGYNK